MVTVATHVDINEAVIKTGEVKSESNFLKATIPVQKATVSPQQRQVQMDSTGEQPLEQAHIFSLSGTLIYNHMASRKARSSILQEDQPLPKEGAKL